MSMIKNLSILILLVCVLVQVCGCTDSFDSYTLNTMIESCKEHGGIHHVVTVVVRPNWEVFCQDGEAFSVDGNVIRQVK